MTELEPYINQIILGDCLEIMKDFPDKSIDLIVTDPPYGLNYNNGDLAHRREKAFGGKVENMKPKPIMGDDKNANKLFRNFLIQVKRILKHGACCCCCCCGGGPKPLFAQWIMLMDRYIGFKQAVVWNKGGLGMGIHYRRNYEFMLIAQNGDPAHRWNGGNNTPNLISIGKIIPREEEHTTLKPVDLFKFFIKIHSNPNDIVLDPFLGSGTTAVAAAELGRRFIGIEIDPAYHATATKRVTAVLNQQKLFP